MNQFKDIELNSYLSEDTDIDRRVNCLKKRISLDIRIFIIFKNISSFLIVGGSVYLFIKYVNGLMCLFSSFKRYCVYLGFAIFTIAFVLLYRMLISLLWGKVQKSRTVMQMSLLKANIKINTIRSLYKDLKERNMEIIDVAKNSLYVSAKINGKQIDFHIPVNYQLFESDKNRIDFFDDHIDIYLAKSIQI